MSRKADDHRPLQQFSDNSSRGSSTGSESPSQLQPHGSAKEPAEEIEIICHTLPLDVRAGVVAGLTRWVKTTTNATVYHLSKYLSFGFPLHGKEGVGGTTGNKQFDIYMSSYPGSYVRLDGSTTLEQIKRFWKFDTPVEIFYSSSNHGPELTQR